MGNINAVGRTWTRDGDVAVIAMDNPPVNALGNALRSGLVQALDQLASAPR